MFVSGVYLVWICRNGRGDGFDVPAGAGVLTTKEGPKRPSRGVKPTSNYVAGPGLPTIS
jgi:hypothetical protein